MTTIAFRDGFMAADTLGSLGGLKFSARKVHRINLGGEPVLIGHAGSLAACRALLDWLEGGQADELPSWAYKVDEGTGGMIDVMKLEE